MKYIIFGLGNFGSSLGQKLTEQGNEVIGVDNDMGKVDALKEKISHTVCLDSTDQFTVSGLPLKDTDVVIVAIGEDQGANIMTSAVLKNLNVKRLISRAITPLHENVLEAMGIDEIVHPEEETAERWAKKLCLKGVVDSFELSGQYSIVEVSVPAKYFGQTLQEIGFRRTHNLVVLTTIKRKEEKNIIGINRGVKQVQGVASPRTLLEEGDIMVIYGDNKDIKRLLNDK
ncbi:MAG: TrkA family potassium uptake protein [Bacteroidetes bacterium]|nr:MAG: TrkA family potassium uptake protein [Bacteroidota bacterium]MBL1145088.1 TrkA family potassium uptake protein [Bacteroidota bacterium]MCB0802125.1 TrkA family potassium uptake protein [Flavobacteriales bacterium]NOG57885.1 TrkA family potassium uptake protein [Bacteroidota bacterium]